MAVAILPNFVLGSKSRSVKTRHPFSSQNQLSLIWIKFSFIKRRKSFTHHLYQITVMESMDDVLSALERILKAEI